MGREARGYGAVIERASGLSFSRYSAAMSSEEDVNQHSADGGGGDQKEGGVKGGGGKKGGVARGKEGTGVVAKPPRQETWKFQRTFSAIGQSYFGFAMVAALLSAVVAWWWPYAVMRSQWHEGVLAPLRALRLPAGKTFSPMHDRASWRAACGAVEVRLPLITSPFKLHLRRGAARWSCSLLAPRPPARCSPTLV